MAWMLTHLTTIVFLYHYDEDGRISGRNMSVEDIINKWKYIMKLKWIFWLLVQFKNRINARYMEHIEIDKTRLIFQADRVMFNIKEIVHCEYAAKRDRSRYVRVGRACGRHRYFV